MLNKTNSTFDFVRSAVSQTVSSLFVTVVAVVELLNFCVVVAEYFQPFLIFFGVIVTVALGFGGFKLGVAIS